MDISVLKTFSPRKRVVLNLEQKIEVIKHAAENPGISFRAIGEKHGIGKTQVSTILKSKDSIIAAFESNSPTYKRARMSKFSSVNEALYSWYTAACSNKTRPTGPQLIAKAKEISVHLGVDGFKGTGGWLSKWKQRFVTDKPIAVRNDSDDISAADTVTTSSNSWEDQLSEILRDYKTEDIFSLKETGCFWKALPKHGFGEKEKIHAEIKHNKSRFTIAFLVSGAGVKLKPVVIWSCKSPRCFEGINVTELPVKYYHEKNSWMTGEILYDYLTAFNQEMLFQKRSVVLLLDTASCHPPELLEEKFSNTKVVFLPDNTASSMQPLDLGVITNFKVHYKRLLLQHQLAKVDDVSSTTNVTQSIADIAKAITVLTAIRWVGLAWSSVNSSTIQKSFTKVGILAETKLDDAQSVSDDQNLFADVQSAALSCLIDQAMAPLDHCSVEEYIIGEEALPVCDDFFLDSEDWDKSWMENLANSTDVDGEVEDEDFDPCPPPPKITCLKQAIETLEDVTTFLEQEGQVEQATSVFQVITDLAELKAVNLTQTTLEKYFA